MKTKTVPIEVKAVGDAGEGRFSAYASVFGNVDSYGDKVVPGAFAESLAGDFKDGGAGVPLYWRHRMDDPFMNLGVTVTAVEDSKGLLVDCQLDLETPAAAQTYRLLKEGRVSQMSFAYDVLEGAMVDSDDEGSYFELRKLRLHEVSVVPVGANQETEILSVKSAVDDVVADLNSGRVITAEDRSELIASARSFSKAIDAALGIVPAAVSPAATDDQSEAKSEEPLGVNDEEPVAVASARALATNQLIQTLG